MLKIALALVLWAATVGTAVAETPAERLHDSAELFREIMAAPDRSIPQDLLARATCIVIVPGMKKAAFGFGGKYGRGFAVCRQPSHGSGRSPAVRLLPAYG